MLVLGYAKEDWQGHIPPAQLAGVQAALMQRGSLTVWVSKEALSAWHDEVRTGRPGAPRTYRDIAITCMVVLAVVYWLTLRTTQGLIASVLPLLKVGLPVPAYTTLCRRR